MKNNRAEWRRCWKPEGECCGSGPTYPRDGRETVFEEYERVMPTTTVRELLAAYAAAIPFGELPAPSLPADFADYVLQRTGTFFGLERLDPDSTVDRFGGIYAPNVRGDRDRSAAAGTGANVEARSKNGR